MERKQLLKFDKTISTEKDIVILALHPTLC